MSNINATIIALNNTASAIAIVLSSISLILGTVGLLLNTVVFTQPKFRKKPSSLYFLTSTYFSLFITLVVVPVRLYTNSTFIDPANYNLIVCKIEYFVFYFPRTASCWLIVMATIDRYLHSSTDARIRLLSSMKTARIACIVISITSVLIYVHILVYFEINTTKNQFGIAIPLCRGQNGFYRTFIGFFHMIAYALSPCFFMLLFGLLTIQKLRQNRRLLPAVICSRNHHLMKPSDVKLVSMLIAQVFVIILSVLPFSINNIYASCTLNVQKDAFRIAQENVITQTVNTMTSFAHTTSFYLYTLSGSLFRRELFKIYRRVLRPNTNLSHPRTNERNNT
ncbi:unnamed protein product [Adineta ricciae]|uniref:G-protein coupled receptors family 1 profile domain-containing protein n=1 Tax=Adineta ricciae TaxID=249248 RepID=A0A814VZK0_ADIRI|nr:unnamed protein product [Adineta ricciae]